jgi:FMN-dependent NADH-azoreductase
MSWWSAPLCTTSASQANSRRGSTGRTFAYTEKGPKGLAGGKTVIIASSRGGFYGPETPLSAIDFQEKYLTAVFRFFGITDIRFLRAEGVNVSPEARQQAIAAAERDIAQLIAA